MFIRSNKALRIETSNIRVNSILKVNKNKATVTEMKTAMEKMLFPTLLIPPRLLLSNFSRMSYFESSL